jgi:hypothetical protein
MTVSKKPHSNVSVTIGSSKMSVRQQLARLQALYVQKWLALFLLTLTLEAEGLPRSSLFEFGLDAGDRFTFRNDDDNTPQICPTVPYTFFGVQRSCFVVSAAGWFVVLDCCAD